MVCEVWMVDSLEDVKGCMVCDLCNGCLVENTLKLKVVGLFSVVEVKETFI